MTDRPPTTLQFNTTVRFGYGTRSLLPTELRALGVTRPMIITDRGVITAGVVDLAWEAMPEPPTARFDDTPPNPTEAAASDALELFRSSGADGIVGIGGGAALDLTKAIAVLAGAAPGREGTLWEYCNRHPKPRAIADPPPLILLPTTFGSGSEVGRSAVIIFDNGIKAGIGCPRIVSVAICDPELTLSLPPFMTAATGMDALSHCIETFCSPALNPPTDAIVLDGLARLASAIEVATQNGSHRDARWDMMMGAVQGAIGFQKGLGAVHALSHALGPIGYHHGTLNALLLPHVLEVNLGGLGEKDAGLRRAMRLEPGADIPTALLELNKRLGLPAGLRALGFEMASADSIARAAMNDNAHRTNPTLLMHAQYKSILNNAM